MMRFKCCIALRAGGWERRVKEIEFVARRKEG